MLAFNGCNYKKSGVNQLLRYFFHISIQDLGDLKKYNTLFRFLPLGAKMWIGYDIPTYFFAIRLVLFGACIEFLEWH